MSGLRIRCQVLKVIAGMDQGTAKDVHKHLLHLDAKQVQKALYELCMDDEIRKIGVVEREHCNGKPWNIYKCREENQPIDESKKKIYKKSGRKNKKQELQTSISFNAEKNIIMVKYRDRKIKLLEKMLPNISPQYKDLFIGIINDYKKRF